MSAACQRPFKGYQPHLRQAHASGYITHTVAHIGQAEGSYLPPTAMSWSDLLIPCGSCSKVCIAQTGRSLEHHLKEHKRVLTLENTAQSAVAQHAVGQMHERSWKEAEVVNSQSYYCQRCALKAWHICTKHQTINCNEGSCRQSTTTNP